MSPQQIRGYFERAGIKLGQIGNELKKTSRRQWIVALLLVGGLVAVVQARVESQGAREISVAAKARADGHAIPVRTVTVSQSDVVEIIHATAVTVPEISVPVNTGWPTESGPKDYIVRHVHVVPGQFYPKGSLLLEFDDTLFAQTVKQRKAALDAAAQIRESPGQVETRQQVLKAEADFEQARLNLEIARWDLSSCKVFANIDGYADEVRVVVGDRIGFGRTITQLHSLDPIYVVMDLPQERIGKAMVGQSAEVVLDCFSQETFEGTVVRVSPRANTTTRTLPVVIAVPNPEHRIKAGVTGAVRLRITKNAITVPSIAVIRQGKEAMVFRVENGRARIRKVQVGEVVGPGRVEILNGLFEGDVTVIFGNRYLKDNDEVNIDWKGWTGRNRIREQ